MKRVLIAAALVLALVGSASALTWHKANQKTVLWDAVTVLADGSPLPVGEVIQYRVYKRDAKTGVVAEIGVITTPQILLTLADGERVYVGVRAERVVEGEVVAFSVEAWSDVPADCLNGATFGIRFFKDPAGPKSLRP